MRKFFLFCLLIVCFLCCGFLKDGKLNILVDNETRVNDSVLLSAQSFSTYSLDLEDYYNKDLKLNKQQLSLTQIEEQLGLKIVSNIELENRKVITAFTQKLRNFIYLNGEKINIQISLSENEIKIGYPLILGSF